MSVSSEDDDWVIVIDNGSGMFKAGFAGDDAPRSVFPTLTGKPKYDKTFQTGSDIKDCYVGYEAQSKREILALNYPITHGIVTDWDDMEKVWFHAFQDLGISPEQHPVLLTETPLNPKINRELMAELMFESLQTPALHVEVKGILSLFASGRGSGVLFHSGDGVSHIVPIFEGHALPPGIRRFDFAGRDITSYLQNCLHKRGYCFTTSAELDIVRNMKELLCYSAQDFDYEMLSSKMTREKEKNYELPDGSVVTIGSERFQAPEALFKPSLNAVDCSGIHEQIFSTLMACDIDTRATFFCNIILSGGNTMFPGFVDRLEKEMVALAPKTMKVKIVSPPERKLSVWIGGSILGSLSMFQRILLSRQDYFEYGPSVIHRSPNW